MTRFAFARSLAPWVMTLVISACATEYAVDPEGYRCDTGDLCPAGYSCVSGVCTAAPPVTGGGGGEACTSSATCTAPPANGCKDASTLRSYSAVGTCSSAGKCGYASSDIACAAGCADGKCTGDLCAGISCNLPPAPACVNATTLRSYPNAGSCDGSTGQCAFVPTDTTCPSGCDANMCKAVNLCAMVTCNTPPPPECKGGAAVTYAASGTCDAKTGMCGYKESATVCAAGCVAGLCTPASKTFAQVGPRVRSAVTALDLAPGSSGSHALVVGPKGYVAKWDGTTFTQLSSGTTQDLKAVWFRSASVAFIVGNGGTALRYDSMAAMPLTPVSLPGSTGAELVSVHGNAQHTLIAGKDGAAWRITGSTGVKAPAPPTGTTYAMVQAYVAQEAGDDSERIAGLCTNPVTTLGKPCLLYASSGTANTWFADPSSTTALLSSGFTAVGPSTDPGFAFVSQGVAVYRHDKTSGEVDTTNVPTGLAGTSVRGFTRDSNNLNAVFITTTGTQGRLYRWIKGGTPTELLRMYFGSYAMSRNDSGGVLVSDSDLSAANIYRRGAVTNEALDLAESWVDLDVTPGGRQVFINGYADLATVDASKSVFEFTLSPYSALDYTGVVAANGYALVFGKAGRVSKFSSGAFTTQTGSGTSDLNAGCRNSDTEVYLVGNGGKILSYNGTSLTTMASTTTDSLFAVTCTGAGEAWAVGANGSVLKLGSGAWSKVMPQSGTAVALTSVVATPAELYVAGDNVLFVHRQGAWQTLPGKTGLIQLMGVAGNELYAAVGADVVRFDGSGWTTVFTAPSKLSGGAMSGGKVSFVGAAGLLVEGK